MSNTIAEQFRLWLLQHEFRNTDAIWRRAVTTWNRAAAQPRLAAGTAERSLKA
jgi:hypothetical protein